jgi:monofunctional chorismate mutase
VNVPNLDELRGQIDRLDANLVEILARRFRVTEEIGRLKKALALPAVDEEREQRQRTRIQALARQHGLREDVAVRVLRVIIDETVMNHRRA